VKLKSSDEDLTRVEYNANTDSVEILEGVDYMEDLRRRVLMERLEAGIERPVENIGFESDSLDNMFSFSHDDSVTILD